MDDPLFFDTLRSDPFNGSISQSAVDGIYAILEAWERYGDEDERKLAYILGTAFHECDRFRTMEEYASGAAYEGREDLGNTVAGDGKRFKGRGFVMITGRRNYTDWSRRLGIDLVNNPETVCEPEIAARILVQGMMLGTFTGKALGDFISGARCDYEQARRTVNGMDRAEMIAGYAVAFEEALEAAGYDDEPAPVVKESLSTQEPAMPTRKPSPVEQASKAKGAGKGAAQGSVVAGAIVTLLLAMDVLPANLDTAEFGAALGVVLTAVASGVMAIVQSYRAPRNAE